MASAPDADLDDTPDDQFEDDILADRPPKAEAS